MSRLEKLQRTTSLNDLAKLLGYKPKALSYILYILPKEDQYFEFTIPKKNGGKRNIKSPNERLKKLQRHLAKLLNECFEETFTKSKNKSSLSHGFRKKHSIITNANKHKNKRYVFNVDLLDFSPSINFGRVRGFFIKNNHFKLETKVATIIAQIACHDNELPQGSPCSPIISNLIGHLLDIRMVNLAKRAKCTYSRYADDLTFSTNKKDFPKKIAIMKNEHDNKWNASETLINEIKKVGFKINEKKTSLQYKTSRQISTGLVVNEKVNIKKEYYRQARSMCHALFQSNKFYIGSKQLLASEVSEDAPMADTSSPNNTEAVFEKSQPEEKVTASINQLEGILSFIYHVKKPHDVRKSNNRLHKPTSTTKLYRTFFYYKHFFSLNQPLIICEGKTDVIYLKCALKQLEKEYQEFVNRKDDEYIFRISFLNLSKNLRDVFATSTGTSGLVKLMNLYKEYMRSKPFKGEGKKHPVIILTDNDKGAKEIKKMFTEKDLEKSVHHFFENLYVVPVPLKSGHKEAAIEDLFDEKIRNTEINGKKFKRKGKIDNKSEYSKTIFAEKVVKANQNTINFNGFKEVFDRFKGVIEDYNQKKYRINSLN